MLWFHSNILPEDIIHIALRHFHIQTSQIHQNNKLVEKNKLFHRHKVVINEASRSINGGFKTNIEER